MNENEKDAVIKSLSAALIDALDWLCVETKKAPYLVPCQIDGDLSLHRKVNNKSEAYRIIREAVANTTKGPAS